MMKLDQENSGFVPVTLTLETLAEMNLFWDLMQYATRKTQSEQQHQMAIEISNWITNNAKV